MKVCPFSNGTERMRWDDNNCSICAKAWYAPNGEWPSEKTMKEYVRMGKYCKLQYYIDLAAYDGLIPEEIANEIGMKDGRLNWRCSKFSDDDNDKFRYPKRLPPDDGNQLVMPFVIDEIQFQERKEFELAE